MPAECAPAISTPAIRVNPRWSCCTVRVAMPRRTSATSRHTPSISPPGRSTCWGHGYTDKPGHLLEIPHYVDHLVAVLDTIGAQTAHISGESLGGWVASRFAVDHPDRLERLVLNTAGGSQADPEVMKRIITLSMAAAENPSWETVQARIKWLMADKSKDYDDIVASRQRVYRQPGFVNAMRDIMALQDPEIRQRNLMTPSDYGGHQGPHLGVVDQR